LIDVTHAWPQDSQTRELAASEIPTLYKAMAFVSRSEVGSMVVKVFMRLKPQPIPMKLFHTEKEAMNWLQQYLDDDLVQNVLRVRGRRLQKRPNSYEEKQA